MCMRSSVPFHLCCVTALSGWLLKLGPDPGAVASLVGTQNQHLCIRADWTTPILKFTMWICCQPDLSVGLTYFGVDVSLKIGILCLLWFVWHELVTQIALTTVKCISSYAFSEWTQPLVAVIHVHGDVRRVHVSSSKRHLKMLLKLQSYLLIIFLWPPLQTAKH